MCYIFSNWSESRYSSIGLPNRPHVALTSIQGVKTFSCNISFREFKLNTITPTLLLSIYHSITLLFNLNITLLIFSFTPSLKQPSNWIQPSNHLVHPSNQNPLTFIQNGLDGYLQIRMSYRHESWLVWIGWAISLQVSSWKQLSHALATIYSTLATKTNWHPFKIA